MELFNKLSEKEKNQISNYISAYGSNDSDENNFQPKVSLEYLLRFWDNNKKNLYKMFNNNFIISKDIEYLQPIDDIRSTIDKMIENKNLIFPELFYNKLKELYNQNIVNYDTLMKCYLLTSAGTLALNKYVGETFSLVYKDRKITCQEGTKPFRVLGKLAKLLEIEKEYEDFRLAISVATNQKKLSGKLCLSIHPLDFMTMSDNSSGWTSCMSWQDWGCYRMGTVEMMNSGNVICAYLADKDDMEMPDGTTWNNKKWRSLFIVDERGVVSVKGYPYQSSDLVMTVLNWIKELTSDKYGYIDSIPYKQRFQYDGKTYYLSTTTDAMYNDFGKETVHYGMFDKTLQPNDEGLVKLYIHYSGETECLSCGSDECNFNTEGDLVCSNCDNRSMCEECGAYLNEDEIYELDGIYLCEDCYNDYVEVDDITQEKHHQDNMNLIYLITKNQYKHKDDPYGLAFVHDSYYLNVYNDTLEDKGLFYEMTDNMEDILHVSEPFGAAHINYIFAEDLNEYGAHLFGLNDLGELQTYIEERDNEN